MKSCSSASAEDQTVTASSAIWDSSFVNVGNFDASTSKERAEQMSPTTLSALEVEGLEELDSCGVPFWPVVGVIGRNSIPRRVAAFQVCATRPLLRPLYAYLVTPISISLSDFDNVELVSVLSEEKGCQIVLYKEDTIIRWAWAILSCTDSSELENGTSEGNAWSCLGIASSRVFFSFAFN
jgi:hypothetical protein